MRISKQIIRYALLLHANLTNWWPHLKSYEIRFCIIRVIKWNYFLSQQYLHQPMPKSQHAVHMAVQKRWTQLDVHLKPVLKMDVDQVYESRVRTNLVRLNIKRDQNARSKRIFKVSRALEEWQKMITIELVHIVNNSVVPDLRNQLTIVFLELFHHVNPVLETLWPLGTANMDGVTVTVELVTDSVWCKLTEDIIQKLEHGIHKLILNKAWIVKNEPFRTVARICTVKSWYPIKSNWYIDQYNQLCCQKSSQLATRAKN